MPAEGIVIHLPDGKAVPVLCSATPIHKEDGEIVGVVATLQDMTPLEDLVSQRAEFLSMAARAQCFCLLETLEYLVKGGRIGRAQATNGEALDRVNRNRPRGDVEPSHEARCFTLGGCSGWMRRLEKRRRVLRRLIRGLTMSGKSPPSAGMSFISSISSVLQGCYLSVKLVPIAFSPHLDWTAEVSILPPSRVDGIQHRQG